MAACEVREEWKNEGIEKLLLFLARENMSTEEKLASFVVGGCEEIFNQFACRGCSFKNNKLMHYALTRASLSCVSCQS